LRGKATGVAKTEQDRGSFASLLRDLRLKAGWTQEELAEASRLSPKAISLLERGRTQKPQGETVRELVIAFGLDGDARAEFERVAKGHRIDMHATAARASGPLAPSRTLPRDVGSFTGRDDEVRALIRAADKAMGVGGVVAIVEIGGMAGIGKTALAVHAGHLLASQFPDGQIFLPLHGHTPGLRPADSVNALESLLRLVGTTEIPGDAEQRAALWRQYLAGKRVLLVLDDAVHSDQVRLLLPGSAGCLVLITSRVRLKALEDIDFIELRTLPPDDACRLLVDLARRPRLKPDDLSVREITRLCGYLPLGIGLLAAQLRFNPSLGAATLASRLKAAPRRPELINAENQSVATAFDMSYAELSLGQQRMFRRLGLQPGGDVDAYAAAALDATDVTAATRDLDALYDHHLLAQAEADRYRLHDLIREYARALTESDPADEQLVALTRLMDYYLHTAREADRHLARQPATDVPTAVTIPPAHAPELRNRDDALAWMTAESANLHAAADYAATHGMHAHAIAIPAAMTGFVDTTSRWRAGIRLQLIALTAAEDTGDRISAANALTELGWYRQVAGEQAAALRNLTQAVAIQGELGNRSGEAAALRRLGVFRHAAGKSRAAARNLRTALALSRALADKRGEARALYPLGAIQYGQGSYPAATATLKRALRLFHDQDDKLGQADVISYLAAIQAETGHYVKAITMQTEALAIYRGLGDPHNEAGAFIFLGAMRRRIGDYPAAMESLRLAVAIFLELREPFGEASALSEMSGVQRETGDIAGALTNATRSLQLYRDQDSLYGEAEALIHLGAVLTLAGDYAEAAAHLERALELHRGFPNPNGETSTLNALGDLALASGTEDAAGSYEQALGIAVRRSLAFEEARAMEGIARCLTAKGPPMPEGIAWLEQALTIYQRIGSPYAARVSELLAGGLIDRDPAGAQRGDAVGDGQADETPAEAG
jgi:tetratricopeptide (TPR) repeat protein/transcriptional regulator with XRE-family HTH domain